MPRIKYRSARFLLAFLLGTAVATLKPAVRLMAASSTSSDQAQQPTLRNVSANSADIPFPDTESAVEQRLFELANQARQQAGVAPLRLDAGLCRAALIHAQAMLNAQQLSHQFAGELSLPQRLALATSLKLEQEGENVALDYGADQGHEHLMLSPPHRANLLNPAYNVVGLGVVRDQDRLYIVQDFGHALPSYSEAEVKERIADAVNEMRSNLRQPLLSPLELPGLDAAACSMAQADKLAGTPAVHDLSERYSVLSYTSTHPETLPGAAVHALSSRNLHRFSVGNCFARSNMYPTGIYWVVLTLE